MGVGDNAGVVPSVEKSELLGILHCADSVVSYASELITLCFS